MPVWVIGSMVGAWVLLILIEEAGQFFWKRYLEDEPAERGGWAQSSRWQWAAGFVDRVKDARALWAGKARENVLWQKAARFAGLVKGKCATFIRRVRSYPQSERLAAYAGQFSRKASMNFRKAAGSFMRSASLIGAILRSFPILCVKALRMCIDGASTVIRKYRKSSTHL